MIYNETTASSTGSAYDTSLRPRTFSAMLNCNEKDSNILQLAIGLRVSRRQTGVHNHWLNLVLKTIDKRLRRNQYYSFDRKN